MAVAYGYRRPTPEQRSASARKAAATRAKKKALEDEVAATLPPVKPGDIFFTSWGYDQTNVDFYEVVEVSASGKSVKVVKIGNKRDEETSPPQGGPVEYVVPDPLPEYAGSKILTKQLRPDTFQKGWYFKISSYAHAYPWDGQPKYQTGFGWGH